jgi:dihydroorotase/N-acyl-D-amino-acid deacylase
VDLAVAALAASLLLTPRASAQVALYDLVLRNARIVNGTGSPSYRGDVAVKGDTITAIAPTIDGPAIRTINLGGQVLAPGFIDVHNHARIRRGIFQHPTADNFVRQGVTTVIEGPDGSSPVPLAPFLKQLAALSDEGADVHRFRRLDSGRSTAPALPSHAPHSYAG